jgi:hypothetical protein
MSVSPNIETRINTIARELSNGKDRAYILGKYGKKWGKSKTTIDRWIHIAKDRAGELAKLKDKAANDGMIEETKEAVKRGLKSVHDVDLAIQDIIFSKPTFVKNGKTILRVEHTVAEKLRAAMVYYKRHGYIGKDDGEDLDVEITINRKPPHQ